MGHKFHDAEANEQADKWDAEGELRAGSTRRFSHTGCGDTRQRGYITRKYDDSGLLIDLFYCHNCSASGYRSPGHVMPWHTKTDDRTDIDPNVVSLPIDATEIVELNEAVPQSVRRWASDRRVLNSGALWSADLSRIIFPVSHDGELLGYQARRAPWGDARSPKYLTVHKRDTPLRMLVQPDTTVFGDTVPIVVWTEDWVSAHQFRKCPCVWGCPLFGLNVSAEHALWADRAVFWLAERIANHVIWLDNDVKKAAEASDYLTRLLGAMGRKTIRVLESREPKNLTELELADRVKGWRT